MLPVEVVTSRSSSSPEASTEPVSVVTVTAVPGGTVTVYATSHRPSPRHPPLRVRTLPATASLDVGAVPSDERVRRWTTTWEPARPPRRSTLPVPVSTTTFESACGNVVVVVRRCSVKAETTPAVERTTITTATRPPTTRQATTPLLGGGLSAGAGGDGGTGGSGAYCGGCTGVLIGGPPRRGRCRGRARASAGRRARDGGRVPRAAGRAWRRCWTRASRP